MNFAKDIKLSSQAIVLFILIVFGNRLGQNINCSFIKLTENRYFLHTLSLVLFFLSAIILSTEFTNEKIGVQIGLTILFYIYYLLITKSYYIFAFITIILLVVNFTINKHLENSKTPNSKLEKTNIIILLVAFINTLIGDLLYLGKKKYQYGNKFSYLTFFLGKEKECSSSTKGTIKDFVKSII